MNFKLFLPFWNRLSALDQKIIVENSREILYEKDYLILSDENYGFLIVKDGKFRVYIMNEGKEITLYRLYQYDMCFLSANCIFNSINFEVMLKTEEKSIAIWIPSNIYKNIMSKYVCVSNYTNELMANRFSEVMWLLNQVLYKKMDQRVATFLLEELNYFENNKLMITHEQIANHLGSAREVISRLLNYFQKEGIVKSSRGIITIIDKEKLMKVSNGN